MDGDMEIRIRKIDAESPHPRTQRGTDRFRCLHLESDGLEIVVQEAEIYHRPQASRLLGHQENSAVEARRLWVCDQFESLFPQHFLEMLLQKRHFLWVRGTGTHQWSGRQRRLLILKLERVTLSEYRHYPGTGPQILPDPPKVSKSTSHGKGPVYTLHWWHGK